MSASGLKRSFANVVFWWKADVRLDVASSDADGSAMAFRSVWLSRGLILFSAAIVLQGVVERRLDKLVVIGTIAATAIATIAMDGRSPLSVSASRTSAIGRKQSVRSMRPSINCYVANHAEIRG